MGELVKYHKLAAHQRYRTSDGAVVPGASTVAKIGDNPDALLYWAWECGMNGQDYRKVKSNAADIGSLVHFMAECHINGKEPDLSEFSQADIAKAKVCFEKFLKLWSDSNLTHVAAEEQIVSDTYGFGGTIDEVAVGSDGGYVLWDYKTSKGIYDAYLFQVAAYEALWNERNPDKKITKRAIIRIGKKEMGDFEVRWLPELDRHFEVFKAQLAVYKAKQQLK